MRLWPRLSRGKRDRFADLLSVYLDGELEPGEADLLERHLADCDSCRSALSELRQVSSLIQSLPEVTAPRSFALTSAPIVREEKRAIVQSPAYRVLRGATAFAAVALVVLVATSLSLGQGAPGTVPAAAPAPSVQQQARETVPLAMDRAGASQKSLGATLPPGALATAAPEVGLAGSVPASATAVPSAATKAQAPAPAAAEATPWPSAETRAAQDVTTNTYSGSPVSEKVREEAPEATPVPSGSDAATREPARQETASSLSAALSWAEAALGVVLVALLIAIVSIRVSAVRRR